MAEKWLLAGPGAKNLLVNEQLEEPLSPNPGLETSGKPARVQNQRQQLPLTRKLLILIYQSSSFNRPPPDLPLPS
jgi:hypothetical protein